MGNSTSSKSVAKAALAVATTKVVALAAMTTKVIHADGRMDEYGVAVSAGHATLGSPGCYLCNSEAILVGAEAPEVPEAEELKLGQLYFLMPLSGLRCPMSLGDLCRLADMANTSHLGRVLTKIKPFFQEKKIGLAA